MIWNGWRSLIVAAVSWSCVGQLRAEPAPMPRTIARSLSGHDLLLPLAVSGHAAVIVIGFSRGSQKAMEQWDKEIGSQVNAKHGVPLYNVAVIQDAPKFVRVIITKSMKVLVPTAAHDQFLTVVQGQDELKKAVNFSASEDAYIIVLDPSGNIVFNTHGEPSEVAKKLVIERIKDN